MIFFATGRNYCPPKTNYREQPLSTPVLLQDQTPGNNPHAQEGKPQPVRGRGPAPTPPAHRGDLPPAGDRAKGRAAPRGTLVERRWRDRPKCVSLCIFINVSGMRQKNPSAGYSQRGEQAWGRHFCFSFCISTNITKKERKKNQQASAGDESSGYRGGRQIPSDPKFSLLLEPNLNLCSEWCGQRERALSGGEGRGGMGAGSVGERGEETRQKGEGWGFISPAILSRGLCAPPAERPQTRGKSGVRALPINVLPTPRPHPSRGPGTWSGPLTGTAAAPMTRRGTALGWRGTWRTGSWRWRRWWPPQKTAVCRARGPAGLGGGTSGHLCKPCTQGCSWQASELYLQLG